MVSSAISVLEYGFLLLLCSSSFFVEKVDADWYYSYNSSFEDKALLIWWLVCAGICVLCILVSSVIAVVFLMNDRDKGGNNTGQVYAAPRPAYAAPQPVYA